MPVTLADLIRDGKRAEIGCYACRLHRYVAPVMIDLPPNTAVSAVCDRLRCPQCQFENVEQGYPIWARPDARPPKMGASSSFQP